jgi:hypothetical protein
VATIPADDDLVAVDGDANALLAITTRDTPEACDTGTGTTVRGLRVARGGAESTAVVAPAECGKDLGPFWIGTPSGMFVVAWLERVPKASPTSAPIAGLAYRTYVGATLGPIARIAQPADSLVDAGCDEKKCYAVALARAPGKTEMEPEAVSVLSYP